MSILPFIFNFFDVPIISGPRLLLPLSRRMGAGGGGKNNSKTILNLKDTLLSSTKNSLRLKVSDSDASWIGSLMPLAALVGGLLLGSQCLLLGKKGAHRRACRSPSVRVQFL